LSPTHAQGERKRIIDELEHQGTSRAKISTKHRNGTSVIVKVNYTQFTDNSEDNGYIIVYRDITKRKRAEKKLKRTLDELKRSNKELEQFAYVASHDLKEPLRMVSTFTQLLERRYKNRLDDDANDFIEFIVEGCQRMKQLIDDILAYSRVTSHTKEFESVHIEKILDCVLFNLSVFIEENNASITYNSLPTVFVDTSQMVQVFQNLIINAIKFKGKKIPEIHVSAQKGEKEWTIAVSDNGIGIDPEHQEDIFQVFKRLHAREEYPGMGIGLSICQKIVEKHGGRIWVESELGEGSTFYFTIPVIPDDVDY